MKRKADKRATFIRRERGTVRESFQSRKAIGGKTFSAIVRYGAPLRNVSGEGVLERASTDQGVGLDDTPSVRVGNRGDRSGKEFKLCNVGRVVLVSFGRSASLAIKFLVYSQRN